jgi:hypothetical protein
MNLAYLTWRAEMKDKRRGTRRSAAEGDILSSSEQYGAGVDVQHPAQLAAMKLVTLRTTVNRTAGGRHRTDGETRKMSILTA